MLLVSGQGYGSAAPIVTGVSDPLNGDWSLLVNDKSDTLDGWRHVSYAVYDVANAKAALGGLKVTVTQQAGQSAAGAVLLDVGGQVSEDELQFQQTLQRSSQHTLTSPTVTGTAGELAVGLFGAYNMQQTFSAGSGWTVAATAADCTRALAESQLVGTSGPMTAGVNVSSWTDYFSGLLTFADGSTDAPTTSPTLPPVNTPPPTITGTPQEGSTLTASNGSWSNSPTSYAYQWQDCSSSTSCSDIPGATSLSYALQSSDVGKTVDVVVTATNSGGSTPATSAQTGTVRAAPTPPPTPVNTAVPTITGTAQQGQTLTASNGSWSNSPTSYEYQWQDCSSSTSCSNISGATGSSYALQSSDVGKTVDVVVAATNSGGSTPATSAQTGTVQAAPTPSPTNTALPTISGIAEQGQTLTASNGSWSNSPTSYAYQWQDCSGSACTKVSGAVGSSYELQSADVGDTIDVVVTATNAGGSASAPSARTQTVTAASTTSFSPLHVAGTDFVNANGQHVFLHGVNRAGTEYTCIHNLGFFDGTGSNLAAEDAQIASMADWGINSEMITLNEDCWLGINGVPAAYSDSNGAPTAGCSAAQCPYANAIENLVNTDETHGIYPVISLFALAPGTTQASGHIALADNSHAPLFWEEVADFFKGDPYVTFRLEQEPTLGAGSESNWQCWAQGDASYGTASDKTPPTAPTSTGNPDKCQSPGLTSYQAVGMQSLVNIIRGTGAANMITVPGLGYANMLSCGPTTSPTACGMLDSATPPITDPNGNLSAEVDVYPEGNTCGQQLNTSCYDDTYKPVANVMPLYAGEAGENPSSGTSTTFTYVNMLMNWMDANGNGYFPYCWDSWCNLIPGYGNNNSPSTAWGTDYYDHIHNTTPVR